MKQVTLVMGLALGLGGCTGAGARPSRIAVSDVLAPDLVTRDIVTHAALPNNAILRRWDPRYGLLIQTGTTFVWRCGYPIQVESKGKVAHGRLVLFNHEEGADTTAGQGRYAVSIAPERLSDVSGGRRRVEWESYKLGGALYYAWIAVLAEEPIACEGAL